MRCAPDRFDVCTRLALALAAAVPLLVGGASSLRAATPEPTPEQVQFFEEKVRPILAENCYKCHGSEKQKGSLRLDLREMALAGGESGPVIVPGKPDEEPAGRGDQVGIARNAAQRQAERAADRHAAPSGFASAPRCPRTTAAAAASQSARPAASSPTKTASGGRFSRSGGPVCLKSTNPESGICRIPSIAFLRARARRRRPRHRPPKPTAAR